MLIDCMRKWNCSPACTELEMVVMDWAAKLFGLDPVFHGNSGIGGGIILVRTSNGSQGRTSKGPMFRVLHRKPALQ